MDKIYWYAFDKRAKVPTQEPGSVGYDLYALPEGDDDIIIAPHRKHFFHTGLKCIRPDNYWLSFWERSSTGNLQMNLHAGVIDSSYRGALRIILANYTDYYRIFTKGGDKRIDDANKCIYYPLTKAIAQGILLPKLTMEDKAVESAAAWDKLCAEYTSTRGSGAFGSSGKQFGKTDNFNYN